MFISRDWFNLPCDCPLCSVRHRGKHYVCEMCQAKLKPIESGDLQSGQYIPYWLTEPLKQLIYQYKYQQGIYLTSFFTQLMMHLPILPNTEALIPVPLHRKKLSVRGFNQSELIAKKLAKRLNIPCLSTHIKKIKHTESQVQLEKKDRCTNLIDAFIAKPLPYETVTIIDDIYTTGNTTDAVTKAIKESGVTNVQVWCLAKTPKAVLGNIRDSAPNLIHKKP